MHLGLYNVSCYVRWKSQWTSWNFSKISWDWLKFSKLKSHPTSLWLYLLLCCGCFTCWVTNDVIEQIAEVLYHNWVDVPAQTSELGRLESLHVRQLSHTGRLNRRRTTTRNPYSTHTCIRRILRPNIVAKSHRLRKGFGLQEKFRIFLRKRYIFGLLIVKFFFRTRPCSANPNKTGHKSACYWRRCPFNNFIGMHMPPSRASHKVYSHAHMPRRIASMGRHWHKNHHMQFLKKF